MPFVERDRFCEFDPDFPLVNYKKLVAGHNLPSPVIKDFFNDVVGSEDPGLTPNEAEQAVFDNFVNSPRVTQLRNGFYLIGFSIQSMKDQKGVLTHEVFHAYTFLNPRYRAVVSDFWKQTVTAEDRASITKEIGLAYNVEDEELVMDEFQAYLIQSNADKDRMRTFVPKYREALIKRLADENIRTLTL